MRCSRPAPAAAPPAPSICPRSLTFSSLMPLPMPEAPDRPLPPTSVLCRAGEGASGAAARACTRQPRASQRGTGSAACC